jgi:hypothetical protein
MLQNKTARALLILLCATLPGHPAMPRANEAGQPVYQIPSSRQLQQGSRLFALLFRQLPLEEIQVLKENQALKEARVLAEGLGFSWQETAAAIQLQDLQQRGWGDYRFSKTVRNGLALQAPHRYHDKHTGAIAKALFKRGMFTGLAMNTLHRYTPTDNRTPTHTADLAHLPNSFYSLYSLAFAARYPRGQLIQLHGFNAKKRRTRTARQADIILSTGSTWANAYLLGTQQCLLSAGWHSLRYPQQVRELGGTRNSIAALLRNMGHPGFLHLEMNLSTRQQLFREPDRQSQFAHCLLESAQ